MSLVWLMLLLSAHLCECVPEKPKRSALNQLTRTLLKKYDCGVRPVHNWTSTTTVSIDLILQSVLDVDGKTQSITISIWYRQVCGPSSHFILHNPGLMSSWSGIQKSLMASTRSLCRLMPSGYLPPSSSCVPSVNAGKSPPIPYVYVNSSGSVKNYRPMQVVLACSLEMYAFPFDKQNCSLTFRSWLHSVKEIDLTLWRSAETIAQDQGQFMNDGEWELLSIPSRYWQIHQDQTDYAHIQFNVLIRRRPLLYVVGLLIPSIFLMLVDVMSFYLPLDSGVRIAFKISILLGYTVFRVNLAGDLPSSALSTPLIGVYFVVCMAMLMLSLIKSILVVKLFHHSEKEVRQMSVSACLLDKYGSGGARVTESTFTSIKTLDHINTSADYELDTSLDGDLLSLTEIHDAPSGPEWLLQELVSLRLALSQEDIESSAQADWLALCSKLDRLLFRLYLLVLTVYSATLLLLWAAWSFA